MSITTAVCPTLAADAVSALLGDEYKVALIRQGALGDHGDLTQNYSDLGADEVKGAGYVAGGQVLKGARLVMRDGRACMDFDPAMWPGGDIHATGALIYSPTRDGRAVCVLDFGGLYGAGVGELFMLPFDCPVRF